MSKPSFDLREMPVITPSPPAPSKDQSRKKRPPKRKTKSALPSGTLITTEQLLGLRPDPSNSIDKLRISTATPTLPLSFFNLFKNLCVLDLRRIGLEVLPPQIIGLENLQKLDVRYNNLTYLPSQIAQLPNLHHLQIDDVRDRKTKLIKQVDNEVSELNPTNTEYHCVCRNTPAHNKIPPMPTLAQLCTRLIIYSIPVTTEDRTNELCWQDLEPLYTTGKFMDQSCEKISQQLPFPSHFLPVRFPYDICSACSEIVLPVHAEVDRIQVVALSRVRLRYVFCSHVCFQKVVEEWEKERMEGVARKLLRQARFDGKVNAGDER